LKFSRFRSVIPETEVHFDLFRRSGRSIGRKGDRFMIGSRFVVAKRFVAIGGVSLLLLAGQHRGSAQLTPVTAQTFSYAPLRVIGTNLFDFSPIIEASLSRNPPTARVLSKFRISGEVAKITPEGVILNCFFGYNYSVDKQRMLMGGTAEVLRGLSLQQMIDRNGGTIDFANWMSMSPEARASIIREPVYGEVMVANCPPERSTVGNSVSLFALNLGERMVPTGGSAGRAMPYFDFGSKFSGAVEQYPIIYKATTNGLVAIRTRATQGTTTTEAKEIRGIRALAEQGYSAFQYDLGMRYLEGKGVQQDEEKAKRWLSSAATNNNRQAIEILERLKADASGFGK
jgi:hypothetical protein